MSFPASFHRQIDQSSYRLEINRSEPGHADIEEFSVKANKDTKTLSCQYSVLYTLWESVHQTPFIERPKLTDVQCFERCMSDSECEKVALPFLKQGYNFKSENTSS